MSMFTLSISCLTTSNLPWIMGQIFQVPLQCCSLQYLTLLPSPVTSTAGCFFFLAVSLHSFWSYFSTHLQQHIVYLLSLEVHFSMPCLFAFSYCSWSSQGKNTGLPFLSPADHILLNSPLWPVHLGRLYMAHSFIELDKAMVYVINLVSFLRLCFHSVCPLRDKDKRFMEATW